MNYTIRFCFADHTGRSQIKQVLKFLLGYLPPDWRKARREEVAIIIEESNLPRTLSFLRRHRRWLMPKQKPVI